MAYTLAAALFRCIIEVNVYGGYLMTHPNSINARSELAVCEHRYEIFRLDALHDDKHDVHSLPYGLKVLLENLLRTEDGVAVTADDIRFLAGWDPRSRDSHEIAFSPARVLLQDFTGVPAVVDLAAMREATTTLGGDPKRINPLVPSELVIDQSVIVEDLAHNESFMRNVEIEYQRNIESYEFLRWGQDAFDNFNVVLLGTGILHHIYL